MAVTMDKIVNLCKNRGIIFQGSEIYGGMGNTWDYGPVGVELKNNIKRAWWKRFVQEDPRTYGVDAAILMNPRVWDASGHTANFSDPKMDCKSCKQRFRADNLIEDHSKGKVSAEAMTNEEMQKYIERFDFVLGPQEHAPYNAGMLSYGGNVYLNIIRNIKEPRFEMALYRILRDLQIHVKVESNER